MSLAGFKKQINKANQYVSEKIGGAESTKLDEDFKEMEVKIDATSNLVEQIQDRVKEYLQPNPVSRARLFSQAQFSKLRTNQPRNVTYPQPEGVLGECMLKHVHELGDDSQFGQALGEAGEAMKQLADIKYALDDNVRQNFLEPLYHLQNKDLKEVMHHRKKLQGRRLDYDCKKRKQKSGSAIGDDELRLAEEKFEESRQLAEAAMHNLLENDVEQISQLCALVEAQLEFHRQSGEVLESVLENLHLRKEDAANRPRTQKVVQKSNRSSQLFSNNFDGSSTGSSETDGMINLSTPMNTPAPNTNSYNNTNSAPTPRKPCAKALYDFEPENEGELGFKEGDMITLTSKIDENWYEGTIHGLNGFFPCNYVDVVVPI